MLDFGNNASEPATNNIRSQSGVKLLETTANNLDRRIISRERKSPIPAADKEIQSRTDASQIIGCISFLLSSARFFL